MRTKTIWQRVSGVRLLIYWLEQVKAVRLMRGVAEQQSRGGAEQTVTEPPPQGTAPDVLHRTAYRVGGGGNRNGGTKTPQSRTTPSAQQVVQRTVKADQGDDGGSQ